EMGWGGEKIILIMIVTERVY
ncbi:hypothetical protein AZZ66_000149, partial [Escherichia coli]